MIQNILNKPFSDITEDDFNTLKQYLSTLEQYKLMVHTHTRKSNTEELDTIRYILKSDESPEKKCKNIFSIIK